MLKLLPLPQLGTPAYTWDGYELKGLFFCQFVQQHNPDGVVNVEAVGRIELEAVTDTARVKIKLNICQDCYDKWKDI